MRLSVVEPEIFGITESSVSLTFRVEDGAGPVDARAEVCVGGERRAVCEGPPGTRSLRIEGLDPASEYRIEIHVDGAGPAQPDRYFPESVRTLPAPSAREVARFATLNDLHFGEPRFGGVLLENGDYGDEAPGHPVVNETDTDVPYWRFMNEDAIAEINAAGVEVTIIKGDIADRGRPEQFEAAARAFARFAMPHHAFLGNHDYYARREGLDVDGYALLGQPRAPRRLDLGGWRLLLLDSAEPGEHHGVFPGERLRWLADALEETRERGIPTLLLIHHQPVPPEHLHRFPNRIGLRPEHSLELFELVGRHPQVRGVLIGHTHRNRVRQHGASGPAPFAEVGCTKDYPGVWAHYRLFEDGSFCQEVRRITSERALAHSTLCSGFFGGLYRPFSLGSLEMRSFAVGPIG